MAKDYYSILGLQRNATQEDIKKAFRKLAHEHHPDKKGGDANKFKEASEAYSVLSDEKKRAQYDAFGPTSSGHGGAGFNPNDFQGFDFSGFTQNGQGFEFDLGDIFGDIFGGGRSSRRRGNDIAVDIDLDFKDSIFGTEKEIAIAKTNTCNVCSGSGAKKGSTIETCTICNGKGSVREVRRSIIGSFSTTKTCDTCHGTGKIPKEKCESCKGKGVMHTTSTIKASIPAGIENGEVVRLSGLGEAIQGGSPGDLYLKIHVKPHHSLKKVGNDLTLTHIVKVTNAILGSKETINTLDGNEIINIPEGTQYGDVIKVKGKGVPVGNGKRGDLLVNIKILIPNKISKDVKRIVDELKEKGV
jgi:molecular chaperone DnaJ